VGSSVGLGSEEADGPSVPVGPGEGVAGAVGQGSGDGGVLEGGAGSPVGPGVSGLGEVLPEPSVVGLGLPDVGVGGDEAGTGVDVPVGEGVVPGLAVRAGAAAATVVRASRGDRAARSCLPFFRAGLAWAETRPAAQPSGVACTAASARWVGRPATVVPSSRPSPAKRSW
jgi:hypothetical protein